MKQSVFDEAVSYYDEHYEIIFHAPFLSDAKTRIQDHVEPAGRLCRFCGKGVPEVSFSKTAHAVPEFLGNRDILSMNECDTCNDYFATQYEDHLSKWSQYPRALSQIKGKKKKPTFKNPTETLRVVLIRLVCKSPSLILPSPVRHFRDRATYVASPR